MDTKNVLLFDAIGFIITFIVIISNFDIKKYQYRKRFLLIMSITVAFLLLTDAIFHVSLDLLSNKYGIIALYIIKSLSFLCTSFLMFNYACYTSYLIWHEDYKQKLAFKLGLSFLILDIFALILNGYKTLIFNISFEGYKLFEPGYYLYIGLNLLMYLFSISVLIVFRKRINKGFVPLIGILIIPLVLPGYTSLFSKELTDFFSIYAIAVLFIFYLAQGTRTFYDELAGIPNRTYIFRKLSYWYTKEEDFNISSLLVDIENMNYINDNFGHDFGDMIIQKIGTILYETYIRYPNITPARFKGNDFILIWIEKDQQQFELMKTEILKKCNERLYFKDKNYKVDVSIGSYIGSKKENSTQALFLSKVDEKMFLSKNEVARMIDDFITEDKFEVYYQPIFNLQTNKYQAAEALLRAKDKNGKFINPELIVTTAEKTGQITKIGEIITEKTCRFCSCEEFKNLGIKTMDINLSINQCLTPGLSNELINIIDNYKIPHENICFELTESAVVSKEDAFFDNVNILDKNNIKISLDDFGKGYSNLQRIATIPLSIIKIDQSITRNINDNKIQIILDNLIKMIKDLKIKIVVEGVEEENQLNYFKNYNVEMIQGYYYSKPLSEDDFIKFITNYNKKESI